MEHEGLETSFNHEPKGKTAIFMDMQHRLNQQSALLEDDYNEETEDL